MKVLHVIPSISDTRGGPSRAALDMVRALRARQIDARVVTTNDDGPGLLDVPLRQWTTYDGVPAYFCPKFAPPLGAVREFGFSAALTRWLWRYGPAYDLIHVHAVFCYASTAAMAVARLKGIPYLTTTHGLLCEWALQQSPRRKQTYLQLIERANLNGSQALHFNSQKEQQETLALGLNSAGVVVPHGLSLPARIPEANRTLRQQLALPVDEPLILFLSRLHPVKGLDHLIPALGRLKGHRFTFLLAGSGPPDYEQEVTALLAAAGIQPKTRRLGFVQGEQKALLLQGADLFVQSSRMESFGLAVLEALAAGTPALVTPGVALAPLVQVHRLGWVAELDAARIAATLADILARPAEARMIGEQARRFVAENYTWDRVAGQLAQIYQAILNQQPLPALPLAWAA